jgi:hypothetical protein
MQVPLETYGVAGGSGGRGGGAGEGGGGIDEKGGKGADGGCDNVCGGDGGCASGGSGDGTGGDEDGAGGDGGGWRRGDEYGLDSRAVSISPSGAIVICVHLNGSSSVNGLSKSPAEAPIQAVTLQDAAELVLAL